MMNIWPKDFFEPDELDKVIQDASGSNISDWDYRIIVHNMLGYIRYSTSIEATRQHFFGLVKSAMEGKPKP